MTEETQEQFEEKAELAFKPVKKQAPPWFLKIFAALQIILGFELYSRYEKSGKLVSFVSGLDLSKDLILCSLLIINLVSAIGILRGKKWGWWLSAFYFAHSLFTSLATIIITIIVFSFTGAELAAPSLDTHKIFVTQLPKIFICCMVLYFYSRDNALRYFRITTPKNKLFAVVGAIAILLLIVRVILKIA